MKKPKSNSKKSSLKFSYNPADEIARANLRRGFESLIERFDLHIQIEEERSELMEQSEVYLNTYTKRYNQDAGVNNTIFQTHSSIAEDNCQKAGRRIKRLDKIKELQNGLLSMRKRNPESKLVRIAADLFQRAIIYELASEPLQFELEDTSNLLARMNRAFDYGLALRALAGKGAYLKSYPFDL